MSEVVIKTTPADANIERAILGCCILSKESYFKALEFIHDSYFYVPSHQQIFEAVKNLYESNQPVDYMTLSIELEKRGILEIVGGFLYLSDIVSSLPSLAHLESYLNLGFEYSQRRDLIKLGSKIIDDAYSREKEFDRLIDEAEKLILAVNQKKAINNLTHIQETANKRFDRYSRIKDGEKLEDDEKVLTGYIALDGILKIYNNDFVIIGARPAQGKTTLAFNVAIGICRQNQLKNESKPVLIFSLEMSKDEIVDKMISMLSGISKYKLDEGLTNDQEWDRVQDAVIALNKTPIYVDDLASSTANQMLASARRVKAQHKEIGAIIIDYLQLAESEVNELNRVQEISKISRTCKKMAMELKTPVIALSQLSRKVEERQNKRPQLSDLRESGSLEQDANSVVFIYRDEYYNPDSTKTRIAEIIIAKQRRGPTGTIEMYFDGELSRFTSLEK